MIIITLQLRDDEKGRAFAERLEFIQDQLRRAIPAGESWMKITMLGDEVHARIIDWPITRAADPDPAGRPRSAP
jgi:hypothetical protein